MVTLFTMFEGISWANIIEGISVTVGSAVVLTLIYRFRKIIAAWLKRRFNRIVRSMKISQCFPRHTLEFRRLIRQNRQLTSINDRLRVKLGKLDLQGTQREEQLREAQQNLLIFALDRGEWELADATIKLRWALEFTQLVAGSCLEEEFLRRDVRINYARNEKRDTYIITHKGRKFLFDRGVFPSN